MGFFVCRYQKRLEPCVKEYLDSKKLTLDNWLNSVKNSRRGDILYVYFLSMVTGMHLKHGLIWSTLKLVPILHDELMSRCNLHIVYLGFGIFLHLRLWPPLEVNVLPTLSVITSNQPKVLQQLVATGI